MVSPSWYWPLKRASARGSSILFWMVRRSGRAPYSRIVAVLGELGQGSVAKFEAEVAVSEALAEVVGHDAHNLLEFVSGEWVEDHDVVDTVQEFRTEGLFEVVHDLALHGFVVHFGLGVFIVYAGEAQALAVHDGLRAEVGGHDDDGVFEVHHTALAIGQAAVVQDLQEDVEDIRMGFFDFIQEDDAVWFTAYGFGELTTFIVAHIPRRSPHKAADCEFFHVFTHVDTNHGVFIVKEGFCQGFGKLGFTQPR